MKKYNYCIDCKKIKTNNTSKRCRLCFGKIHSKQMKNNKFAFKNGNTYKKYRCFVCKKEINYTTFWYSSGLCRSCTNKKLHKNGIYNNKGKNNGNWRGGIDKDPYPLKFNNLFKESIRKRDNYKCQLCNKTQKEQLKKLDKKLSIHHIDYNKQNLKKTNLIALCHGCNLKVNFNRDYWYSYFKYIMENK